MTGRGDASSAGRRERFVVCGENSLTLRIVEALRRQGSARPVDVVVVVADREGPHVARIAAVPGVRVVEGPDDDATFRTAGVVGATGVALVDREDVANIHRALRVQELSPGTRLVVRLFTTALATRIRLLLPTATVLSVSATAAPSFVTAAIGQADRRRVDVSGRPFVVAERSSVRPRDVLGTLAQRRPGQTAVLLPGDAPPPPDPAPEIPTGIPSDVPVGPAPDERPGAQDLVLARLPVHADSGRPVGTRRARIRSVTAAGWARVKATMTRSLARATLTLLALLVLGTVAFATLTGLSWGDAVFLTVLDSAGAADPDTHLDPVARTIQALVTVVGIAIIPLVTAVVVDAAVSARFAATPQRSRPRRDHVVVVGLGNVGVRVVAQLRERGVPVVAVEGDETRPGVAQVRRLGVAVVVGDATREQTLREASVGDCRALVAVTSDDVANLETGLVARSMRPRLRVTLRLRDDDLAVRVERSLPGVVSRSVSFVAAPNFAAALRDGQVLATIPVGRQVLLMADVTVGRSSLVVGLPAPLAAVDGQVHVVGVALGSSAEAVLETPPRPQRPLRVGDRLLVVATRAGLVEVLERCASRSRPSPD